MAFFDLFKSSPASALSRVEPTVVTKATGFIDGQPIANNANYPLVGSQSGYSSLYGTYGSNATGIPVTPWSAITSSPVYACVRVLSEDLARLPIKIRKRLPNGGWVVDETHNLNNVFENPNSWQNAFDCVSFMVSCLALRGNAYAVVLRNGAGVPYSLLPISPDRISILVKTDGEILYHLSHQTLENDTGIVLDRNDVVHIKNFSVNGYMGVSPIQACASSIGINLALEQHSATLFANGASIGGFIKVAGKLSPEAATRLGESMANRHAGVSNAGRIMVLEAGSEFTPTMMTSRDAQFIEARQFGIVDAGRIFRVPPHKLMALEESHYDNQESANQDYIDSTLLPMARRMEQEFERVMLFNNERRLYQIRFDFDEMLRGDTATRYNSYSVGLTNGFLSRNEVRSREGLPPVEGGDKFMVPLNMGDPNAGNRPDDPMPAER